MDIENIYSKLPSLVWKGQQIIEEKEEKIMEALETHFNTLKEATNLREKEIHNDNLFNTVCGNIRNDLKSLDL